MEPSSNKASQHAIKALAPSHSSGTEFYPSDGGFALASPLAARPFVRALRRVFFAVVRPFAACFSLFDFARLKHSSDSHFPNFSVALLGSWNLNLRDGQLPDLPLIVADCGRWQPTAMPRAPRGCPFQDTTALRTPPG